MPASCRVALLFDLDRADRETAELIRGVRRFAEQAPHWRCVVLPHLPRELRPAIDGVIARADRRLAERCHAAGVAYVAVSQTSILTPMARVVPNWEAAGRLAARHVNDRGYETLGCISFPRDPHSRLQAQGFRSACRVPRGYTLIIPRTFYQRTAWRFDALVASAVGWIAEHCHQPIRVAHVAAAVGLPERELRRRCRAFRRRSIVQEIALARIERAQSLLASGESSLDEVARGAGFSSARYMAQVFRRHEGHSPREYRKRKR